MWIKKFDRYQYYLNLNESLNIWYDSLLSSVKAEEINIFDTLKLKDNNIDMVHLNENEDFISALASIGLKKSNMELSSDYETFLNTPCRFMFIYDIDANELETPNYMLMQIYNNSLNKFEETKCYKINDDIKKFYDKLSTKVIEISDGNDKFIYQTSNGNEWSLKSIHNNEFFKKVMSKEELMKTIKERQCKTKVV